MIFNVNKEDAKSNGVYIIKNLKNGKYYCGSTCTTFSRRYKEHLNALRLKKHHSQHLQRAWEKYGENNFSFEILEKLTKEESSDREFLLTVEQQYLSSGTCDYNFCKFAGNTQGRFISEATKSQISNSLRPHGYSFVSPEGETVYFYNLTAFCKQHNLSKSSMGAIDREVQKSHKGWTKPNVKKIFMSSSDIVSRQFRPNGYTFLSPDNKPTHFYNLTQFCRNNNLSLTGMKNVDSGKQDYHKGWTKYYPKNPPDNLQCSLDI